MYQFWNKKNWDYNRYVKEQISENKRKIDWIWVTKEDIAYISKFITGKGI